WVAWQRDWQGRLAGSRDPLGEGTRLDSASFEYSATPKLELRIKGVNISSARDADRLKEALAAAVEAEVHAVGQPYGGDVGEVGALPASLAELQSAIAAREALDGTLLTRARYDAGGQLRFEGVLSPKKGQDLLAGVIDDFRGKMGSWMREGDK